jgi:hypothetical protein
MEWIIVFVIICVIGVVFNWLFPEPPKPTKWREVTEEERKEMIKKYNVYYERQKLREDKMMESRRLYYDSLKSRDKSKSVDLGKKFYRYNECSTIFQQNNIQLQIQNDILSHS